MFRRYFFQFQKSVIIFGNKHSYQCRYFSILDPIIGDSSNLTLSIPIKLNNEVHIYISQLKEYYDSSLTNFIINILISGKVTH